MRKFRQMRSSFNDPDDVMYSAEFETLKELLELDYVKRFTKYRYFSRFELSENTLMAAFHEGLEWWVVGNIDNVAGLNLPKWRARYHVELPNGEITYLSEEVKSSCGDILTLRDGTEARWIR